MNVSNCSSANNSFKFQVKNIILFFENHRIQGSIFKLYSMTEMCYNFTLKIKSYFTLSVI